MSSIWRKYEDYGVEAIIYTDIGRDGMLSGVNVEATVRLAQALSIPVIASGGLSSVADVEKLCGVEGEGVIGSIAGRAIYDGNRSTSRRPRLRRQGWALMGLAKTIIPVSTLPPAGWSKAPISSICAMPAIRSKSPAVMTSRERMRSPSSTSPRPAISATSSCTSSKPVPSRSSSRSPSAVAVRKVEDVRRLLNAGR